MGKRGEERERQRIEMEENKKGRKGGRKRGREGDRERGKEKGKNEDGSCLQTPNLFFYYIIVYAKPYIFPPSGFILRL